MVSPCLSNVMKSGAAPQGGGGAPSVTIWLEEGKEPCLEAVLSKPEVIFAIGDVFPQPGRRVSSDSLHCTRPLRSSAPSPTIPMMEDSLQCIKNERQEWQKIVLSQIMGFTL